MKKKFIIAFIVVAMFLCVTGIIFLCTRKEKSKPLKKPSETIPPISYPERNFNLNLIKTVNSTQKGNYLISPYSIEVALSMLREGSNGSTLEEIENIVPKRMINDISIKNKIGIANALFLKDQYANYIEKDYIVILQKDYNAGVINDKFITPNSINNWVNKNTYKMIPKILDNISKDFVLGLANALAIDVEWRNSFECENTTKESFTKNNHEKINVEMMHKMIEWNASYFETDKATGITLPYNCYNKNGEEKICNEEQLEFIGILPKEEDIYSYIEKLTEEELNKIDENQEEVSNDLHISLSLPRFRYDFSLDNFMDILKAMGINSAFDGEKADFTNIMTRENMKQSEVYNLYVDTAIHKTHIDLNEKGTKAAAVTFLGLSKATAIEQKPKIIFMKFDKPFAYIIRDKKTKEVLFFGVVNEPNQWKKKTCEESK